MYVIKYEANKKKVLLLLLLTSYLSLLASHRGASWVYYFLASTLMISLRFPKTVPYNVMLMIPNF